VHVNALSERHGLKSLGFFDTGVSTRWWQTHWGASN